VQTRVFVSLGTSRVASSSPERVHVVQIGHGSHPVSFPLGRDSSLPGSKAVLA
jgi:hypothetical protein